MAEIYSLCGTPWGELLVFRLGAGYCADLFGAGFNNRKTQLSTRGKMAIQGILERGRLEITKKPY